MNDELKKAAAAMGRVGGKSKSTRKMKALKVNRKKSIQATILAAIARRAANEGDSRGLEIATMRAKAGMTQTQLAELMKTTRQTIHAWERNRPEIGERSFQQIKDKIERWRAENIT